MRDIVALLCTIMYICRFDGGNSAGLDSNN